MCRIHSLVLFIFVRILHKSDFAAPLPEPIKHVYRKLPSLWKAALVKMMSRKSDENIRNIEEDVEDKMFYKFT